MFDQVENPGPEGEKVDPGQDFLSVDHARSRKSKILQLELNKIILYQAIRWFA